MTTLSQPTVPNLLGSARPGFTKPAGMSCLTGQGKLVPAILEALPGPLGLACIGQATGHPSFTVVPGLNRITLLMILVKSHGLLVPSPLFAPLALRPWMLTGRKRLTPPGFRAIRHPTESPGIARAPVEAENTWSTISCLERHRTFGIDFTRCTWATIATRVTRTGGPLF